MRRRELISIVIGAAAWPLVARAQQKAMPVIGVLSTGSPGPSSPFMGAFRQGLSEAGYVEGQNLAIEYRWAEGNYDRLPALAADLVGRKVDVILASAGPAAQAAKTATASVPIVFVVTSPVEMGLVLSLGHPGGNITGLDFNSADLAGKRLELLRELVPTLTRVAVLWDRGNPNNPLQLEGVETAARRLGIQLEPIPVQRADDFDAGFKAMRGADGLLQLGSSLFNGSQTSQPGTACRQHTASGRVWRPGVSCLTGRAFSISSGAAPRLWTRF